MDLEIICLPPFLRQYFFACAYISICYVDPLKSPFKKDVYYD